jgi:LysM repeat protein
MMAPATASAAFLHVVLPGESLSSVAATDGLTVEQLATANGLPATAELTTGSQLVIPPQLAGVSSEASTPVASEQAGAPAGKETGSGVEVPTSEASSSQYVVQPGDTLSALAAVAGTTVAQLAAANGLDPNAPLLSGTTLTLGGAGSTTSYVANAASEGESQPVAVATEGSPEGPPYPTPQTVSSAEVSSIAAANGVPPSLANAIAYQESGLNNELVSSANARGVMQITPGTWSWIDETLAGPTPLEPSSALDNVRGGVLLLHSLLQATGGDQTLAAAGYYQGLPSVLQEGMYPSTREYVANIQALQQRFGSE